MPVIGDRIGVGEVGSGVRKKWMKVLIKALNIS